MFQVQTARAARRRQRRVLGLSAAVAAGVAAASARTAHAADFAYTSPNTTNAAPGDQWSAGTNWAGGTPPASGAGNTLTFTGPSTTGVTRFANNDIAGTFALTGLTLAGTGPAGNGAFAALNITGNPLQFQAAGATAPTITLTGTVGTTGTPVPAYTLGVANNLVLDATTTLQGNGTATFSLTGLITGPGGLTKNGTSAFGASGANTFAGGLTLNAGTVRVSGDSTGTPGSPTAGPLGIGTITLNGGTLSAGNPTNARTLLNAVTFGGNAGLGSAVNTAPLTLAGPATLTGSRTLTANSTVTLAGGLGEAGGSFGLTKAGAGVLVLGGASTYGGATSVTGGALQFNGTAAIAGTGRTVTAAAGAAAAAGFPIDQAFLDRIATASAGSAALAVNSANNLDFAAFPTLSLGAVGTVTYGGTVTPNGSTFRLGGGGGTLSLANPLAGNNAVAVAGPGVVVLPAGSTYAGATTVAATGALRVQDAAAIPAGSAVTVAAGGEVQLANGVTVAGRSITINGTGVSDSSGALKSVGTGTAIWAGPVVLGADGARIGTTGTTAASAMVVSGAISDPGGAQAFGPAVRVPNGSAAVVVFGGANTYRGPTSVVVGTLRVGADAALPATTTVVMGNASGQGSAALDLGGFSPTVAGLQTVAGNNVPATLTNASATRSVLTIAAAANSTFGSGTTTRFGTVTGNLAIVKTGAGTLTFAGTANNSYTGGTTITGGTLAAQVNNALGAGDVSVLPAAAANAVLNLESAGVTTGAIADAATLVLASDATGGTPRYGQVAFGASTLTETVNGLVVDGVPLAPNTYRAADLPNFITGAGAIQVLTLVPEPGSAGLAAAAAAGLLGRRRSRRW